MYIELFNVHTLKLQIEEVAGIKGMTNDLYIMTTNINF